MAPRARDRTADAADLVVVGEVTRPHGLEGAVRVFPVTDFPEHLLALRTVVIVDARTARAARVEHAAPAGRFVAMKLSGVETLASAEALRGATLRIPADEVQPLPPGQFYVYQIVGLRARTPDGTPLGEVADVLRTGANDVYVVRPPVGRDVLLPAVEGVVERIDVAAGEIVVRPPEWL